MNILKRYKKFITKNIISAKVRTWNLVLLIWQLIINLHIDPSLSFLISK